MYGATPPNKAKIEGCLSLLQSWVWFRFPFLRPRAIYIPTHNELYWNTYRF
ncbi:hypothetical protein Gotur_035718 [Gossypium turneri]